MILYYRCIDFWLMVHSMSHMTKILSIESSYQSPTCWTWGIEVWLHKNLECKDLASRWPQIKSTFTWVLASVSRRKTLTFLWLLVTMYSDSSLSSISDVVDEASGSESSEDEYKPLNTKKGRRTGKASQKAALTLDIQDLGEPKSKYYRPQKLSCK